MGYYKASCQLVSLRAKTKLLRLQGHRASFPLPSPPPTLLQALAPPWDTHTFGRDVGKHGGRNSLGDISHFSYLGDKHWAYPVKFQAHPERHPTRHLDSVLSFSAWTMHLPYPVPSQAHWNSSQSKLFCHPVQLFSQTGVFDRREVGGHQGVAYCQQGMAQAPGQNRTDHKMRAATAITSVKSQIPQYDPTPHLKARCSDLTLSCLHQPSSHQVWEPCWLSKTPSVHV